MEGRRRVKEQLKKRGSFEFYKTSFSYIDMDDDTRASWACPSRAARRRSRRTRCRLARSTRSPQTPRPGRAVPPGGDDVAGHRQGADSDAAWTRRSRSP